MGSLILRTAARFLLPLLLLFSLFMLLRGHDEPGGGFIAGLVAALSFALYLFAFDAPATRRLLGVDTHRLLGVGLTLAILSGIPAIFVGQPFFTSLWWHFELPLFGEVSLGTPLLFDVGVYLVVIGVVTTILLALAEPDVDTEH